MNVDRAASVPLITHDPFFSVWSSADRLYEGDTVHWSQALQRMYGYLTVNGNKYCFMGHKGDHRGIPQTGLSITATSTAYTFENEDVALAVVFTSPLLLDDPLLTARPCTYIRLELQNKTGADVSAALEISSDLVKNTKGKVVGRVLTADHQEAGQVTYASMGKANQHPLGQSGDRITIDWGEVYLAANEPGTQVQFCREQECLRADVQGNQAVTRATLVVAYDDLLSINYMGHWCRGYWTRQYATMPEAVCGSLADQAEVLEKARRLDETIERQAAAFGGEDYVLLCNLSYRQTVAAHKLVADENGEMLFLSKENDSNGCIGTVDVSYPSVPLFLLFGTEYVKGMLRPIFKFAGLPVWEYDFAPHDVGRYPYAAGQVYGVNKVHKKAGCDESNGCIFPFYYQYPRGAQVYDLADQMPVEECGNMLIMTAVVCLLDGSCEFAAPHMEMLRQWLEYLLKYGGDPGEQLCTDDFAGHLSHNVNLAAKAIMGIEAYAQLMKLDGNMTEYQRYHARAAEMAADWERRAKDEECYRLAFDCPGSWSLKYNTVWDKFFDSGLFSEKMYEVEINWYRQQNRQYGVPLDSRRTYTKSDWILWCVMMTEQPEIRTELIAAVARYVRETNSRVPFSDWYDAESGDYCHFIARSVQGGIFMPLLFAKVREKKQR